MKFKKSLSLLLSAVMVMGSAAFVANAVTVDSEPVGYYNQNTLETEARAASSTKDFGATYSAASTTWKTWSPSATSVKLKLYRTGSDNEAGAGAIGEYPMTKDSAGIWSTTLQGNHKNVYYTYLVTVNGTTNETQDVYSKATGVNGNRSMVVDLDSTDPEGWDTDNHVFQATPTSSVVWEVHVRDFSISKDSGVMSTTLLKRASTPYSFSLSTTSARSMRRWLPPHPTATGAMTPSTTMFPRAPIPPTPMTAT